MSNDPFYTSPAWRELRAQFLWEHRVCSVPGCGKPSKHADHVISRRRAPDRELDPRNLKALCHSCHSRKTTAQDGGFGNKPKANYELRAVGCDANAVPFDPNHHWNRS